MPYLVAELLKPDGKKEKYQNIAEAAVKAARDDGVQGIPEISTVKDQVGEIMRTIKRLKDAT